MTLFSLICRGESVHGSTRHIHAIGKEKDLSKLNSLTTASVAHQLVCVK